MRPAIFAEIRMATALLALAASGCGIDLDAGRSVCVCSGGGRFTLSTDAELHCGEDPEGHPTTLDSLAARGWRVVEAVRIEDEDFGWSWDVFIEHPRAGMGCDSAEGPPDARGAQ